MRKPLIFTMAAAMSVGLAAFVPVAANAGAGDTPSTFSLTASGGLSIAVPDGSVTPVNLGTASTGAGTLSHALGNVTVTDGRGALTATWTAAASSTNFTTGGASADETVAKASVGYWAGVGTAQLGQVGAFVPAGTIGTPVSLAGTGANVGQWAGTGNDTVTWTPTVTFTLLPSQVAGTYSGTITHSVS
ncbi:MAG TPA: hypothetical protein VH274_07335 [Mycobacteriales bacterium]|jgi:hypothetical protein|nr:hypothetical protein [Mycobacteriales bacterium]